ncbi:hypothetical protein Tco_0608796 [Tanacetum coccineum]
MFKRRLIAADQASVFMAMMFEQSSSSLGRQRYNVQASVINVKWCLLKITLQAPFLNVQRRVIATDQASVFMLMMSVHISSGLVLHQMTSDHNRSELGIQVHSNEPSSSKLVPKVVPSANKTATSRQELDYYSTFT